jgi:hypothetical protein
MRPNVTETDGFRAQNRIIAVKDGLGWPRRTWVFMPLVRFSPLAWRVSESIGGLAALGVVANVKNILTGS